MKESSPRSVALHFGTCAAFALAAAAAPFVPEAIAAYAGYRYIRSFIYSWREWHAPARVPRHLGARGYRDASTRKRGSATWPMGIALSDRQQIWLSCEDLAHGCVHVGREPIWLRQTAEAMMFGACLNQMGVLIIDDPSGQSIRPRLANLAAPFGRDAGLVAVDLTDPLSNTLRISAETFTGALRAHGISQAAIDVVDALAPILSLLGRRYGSEPMFLYRTYLAHAALMALKDGKYTINGNEVDIGDKTSIDTKMIVDASEMLSKIPTDKIEKACAELIAIVGELSKASSLSLTGGLNLRDAIKSGRMVYIKPSSVWTRHMVIQACFEALEGNMGNTSVIHVTCIEPADLDQLEALQAKAKASGPILSVALTGQRNEEVSPTVIAGSGLRIYGLDEASSTLPFIESTIKTCKFGLYYQPMWLPDNADEKLDRAVKL